MTQSDPNSESDLTARSRWPHALALLLVGATWLMICVGGLVTTLKAGMAFADWPTSDGHNIFLYPWFKAAHDKFIEHGHRLLGTVIGMISIAVCLSVWFLDKRRWIGWLSVFAVVLVILQGILGGMRVELDEVQLAKIHGCVGPLFFSLTVVLAVCTSQWWRQRSLVSTRVSTRLKRVAICTALLAYVQLMLGAQLRHVSPMATASAFQIAVFFHLAVAVILLVNGVVLWRTAKRAIPQAGRMLWPVRCLAALLLGQWLLGTGAWILKYSWPVEIFAETPGLAGWTNTSGGLLQSLVVTGHVAIGSLILGTCVWASLVFCRGLIQSPVISSVSSHGMMGVPT